MKKLPIFLCVAILGCNAETTPELGSTLDGLTFEEWLEVQPRFGDDYYVQGDMPTADLTLLRQVYEREVAQGQSLVVGALDGNPNIWSAADRIRLDYCINTTHFEPEHLARLVRGLDLAAAAWESVANVDFRHLTQHDGALCGPQNNHVMFDVRYHSCRIDPGLRCDCYCTPEVCQWPEQKCEDGGPQNPPPDYVVIGGTACLADRCKACEVPGDPDCTPPAFASAFAPHTLRPKRSLRLGNSKFFDQDDITLAYALRHELGHALGFVHEFSRPDVVGDRDNAPWCEDSGTPQTILSEADLASVMMYGPFSGCHVYNGVAAPQPLYLSPIDQYAVSDLYGATTQYDVVRPNIAESFRPGIAPGDYDGNGVTDLLVRSGRSSNLQLFLNSGDAASPRDLPVTSASYGYGNLGTQLMPGRYHSTGFSDFAIKEDATGRILIDWGANGLNGWDVIYSGYGGHTARVAAADYDGDGLTDLSVKGTDGSWLIDYSSIDNSGNVCAFRPCFGGWNDAFRGYGDDGALPAPADYDGDGKADLAIKNIGGAWNIDFSGECSRAHGLPCFGGFNVTRDGYGFADATPVPGDYNCDGKADLAIKTSAGFFAIDYWEAAFPHYHGWNLWPSAGYGDATWIPVPGKYHPESDRCTDFAVKRRNLGTPDAGMLVDKAYDGFPGINQILWVLP